MKASKDVKITQVENEIRLDGYSAEIRHLAGITASAKEFKTVPISHQLTILGLDKLTIRELRGKKVLDVGCGKGPLVEFLRSNGVDAEGIDSEAPKGSQFFMQKRITGIGQYSGGIPRPNDTYAMILSFQNPTLNYTFAIRSTLPDSITAAMHSSDPEVQQDIVDSHTSAQSTIWEMLRTVKPSGKIIIYPPVLRIEEVMKLDINAGRIFFEHQSVEDTSELINYISWELEEFGLTKSELESAADYGQFNLRSILRKGRK